MDRGDEALRAWIAERIRSRGPIPFVEFMEAALYHPAAGYYCRPAMTTGPDGDFYTSPDLHPAFGLMIARQAVELAQRAQDGGEGGSFHLIECGPGAGRLARDIIAGLAAEHPELGRRTVYTLVEVSGSLRATQERALAGTASDRPLAGVTWSSWSDLLEGRSGPRASAAAGGGRATACVVANEFLDALPVHLVEIVGGELKEVHVAMEGEEFREVLLDPVTDRLVRHLAELAKQGVVLQEGQRAEIGLRALDWVSSLGRLFGGDVSGGAILIDYGHQARELYDPGRHRGTLLCYHRHRVAEDPYARVGEQDMTAHVDFTSIEQRARQAGFDVAGPVSQLRFLVSMGLARRIADLASRPGASLPEVRERLALHALMAPGGMGEVFKVLLLARGLQAASLTGAEDPFR